MVRHALPRDEEEPSGDVRLEAGSNRPAPMNGTGIQEAAFCATEASHMLTGQRVTQEFYREGDAR